MMVKQWLVSQDFEVIPLLDQCKESNGGEKKTSSKRKKKYKSLGPSHRNTSLGTEFEYNKEISSFIVSYITLEFYKLAKAVCLSSLPEGRWLL
jgi:hypothetical protein